MQFLHKTINSLRWTKDRITQSSKFGARVVGCFDYLRYLPLGYNQRWALNGQAQRQYIFSELMELFRFSALIETGTHIGTTALYLHKKSGLPVYTVENDQRRGMHAKVKLLRFRKIHVFLEESKSFLKKLIKILPTINNQLFFYLDAHWDDKMPIKEELQIIFGNWKNSIVMVDDFAVPGDTGYGYQEWSDGKTLCLEYLKDIITEFNLAIFFPLAGSISETGHKRGCVVLAKNKDIIEILQNSKNLKSHKCDTLN